MSQQISANFAGVEDGARQIIKRAEAFAQLQRTWQQNVDQLNTTLAGAGQLVSSGNSELQSTDSALANLF
ncbi:Uncharacterised protein [Mycobacteroides abscessus subsp. abscessus]|nr:Uncharacterised protein [Mycobacteroides abscessus subsp. abscessus]